MLVNERRNRSLFMVEREGWIGRLIWFCVVYFVMIVRDRRFRIRTTYLVILWVCVNGTVPLSLCSYGESALQALYMDPSIVPGGRY